MLHLPVGINTLDKIRSGGFVYVDKTEFAYRIAHKAGAFFLSRPRRFGKSLFLDTLHQLFEGNEKLFEGLYIHDKWDWNTVHPVVKIDFGEGGVRNREELDAKIQEILTINQQRLGIACQFQSNSGCFSELIRLAHEQTGRRTVVLIDEYDKPILDNIENPAVAREMRDGLRDLYSVMKARDAHIQCIFMTGVSKFSKVSLFSGLNNLEDLTIDSQYAAICGYSQEELEASFREHLDGVDLDRFRLWYNGYRWMGEPVYNPFDVLLFLQKGKVFRNYWFETGSPSFLIKLFQQKRYFLPDLESIEVGEEILSSFDVDRITPETLLFQTGYLTIAESFTRRQRLLFRLSIPNMEVRLALSDALITGYTAIDADKYAIQDALYQAMTTFDLPALHGIVHRLFAAVSHRNFTKNDLLDCEGYYASVLYAFFSSLNARIIPEDVTNKGQADLTVILENKVFVMEIKLIQAAEVEGNPALEQVRAKGYSEKYQGRPGMTVYELGLVFSKAKRNLIALDGREVRETSRPQHTPATYIA
ncbi:PD-(D/E)XK nuclease superfamily protein [Desulfonatronum thiosulfatophilum]|uniref:PD-(D/E)XK nuclease superfamily protein n=1 Tax=Desulfonatronum thiosulfatophilum TaxID=617002 RepID=A0A1G6EVX8_9BACT|nr:ATP-binding protein [Desulfonatronum thiosulfatophilum]SDB60955.1 PD-(D/E)XK nuclease superfamily protein [Desulfonatronum thiosulfatophilum]